MITDLAHLRKLNLSWLGKAEKHLIYTKLLKAKDWQCQVPLEDGQKRAWSLEDFMKLFLRSWKLSDSFLALVEDWMYISGEHKLADLWLYWMTSGGVESWCSSLKMWDYMKVCAYSILRLPYHHFLSSSPSLT